MSQDGYEYIKAIVDCGELRWEYKVKGGLCPGSMHHEEDVSEYTEEQIIDLTCEVLTVEDNQRDLVEVQYT